MSSKPVWTEDGRSGEKRFKEVVGNDGSKTIYEELWVEPKPPAKRLAKREVKHIRPVVHTIETELVDEDTQEVLDRKIESVDYDTRMEVRRHIVSESTLSSQAAPTDKDDCDCWVTRDELKEAIVQAVKAVSRDDGDCYVEQYAAPPHYSAPTVETSAPVSAQSVLNEKYDADNENAANTTIWTVVLASACMVLAGGIVAVLVM